MSSTTSELITHKQFIRAGAGAGKTTRLVKTFYNFAKQFHRSHGRWPKVILSTFTKKATQEIKERLLKLAIENNDADFVSYLSKSSLVQISTIHLLLQNILFRFHDRIGFINQIQIIEDSEELTQIFRLIKHEFVNTGEFIELVDHFRLTELTKYIRDCIRLKKEFPNLDFVPAEKLEKITKEKIEQYCYEWQSWLEAIKSFRSDLSLDWQKYLDGIDEYVELLQKFNVDSAIRHFNDLPSKPRFSKTKPVFPVEIHETLEELRDEVDKALNYSDTEEFRSIHQTSHVLFQRLLEKVFDKWQQIQRSTGQITIADLELLSLQIANQFPEEVAAFAKEIDFIMLDEYQDTSPLQVKILQIILIQTNVFIVGDPQQSIYLFRGARTEVFLNQEKHSRESQFEMTSLQINYRSHPEVLQFFNDYFTEHNSQFVAMQAGVDRLSTHTLARVQFLESSDQLQSAVIKILNLKNAGVDFKDIAVLSKKNDDLLQLNSMLKSRGIPADLQTAAGLERKREVLDCVSFLKFIVNPYDDENLFKLLRSPWFYVSDSELYLIRGAQKDKKTGSLWVSLKNFKHATFDKLQLYLQHYLQSGFLFAFERFIFDEKLVTHSAFLDESGRMESNIFKFFQILFESSLTKNFDLNKFVNEKSFLGNSLESNGKSESSPATLTPAVKLLTIHGSKGLQFKHVLVLGMNDIIVPKNFLPIAVDEHKSLYVLALTNPSDGKKISHAWAQELRAQFNQRETDESYRLLYVAMTRAEESVCLISEQRDRSYPNTWKNLFYWPVISEVPEMTIYKNSKIFTERHDKPLDLLTSLLGNFGNIKQLENEPGIFESPQNKPNVALSVSDLLNFNVKNLSELQKTASYSKEKRDGSFRISEQLIDAQAKALAGTRAHTLFESIKYNNFLQDSQLMQSLTKEELAAVQYLKSLQEIPFQEIMNHGSVEFGFKLKIADYVIQGQIDAWGQVGSTVYLLDYKTGDQKYTDKAFAQLELYAQCLARINQITKSSEVLLVAIFPFEGKTILKKSTNVFNY